MDDYHERHGPLWQMGTSLLLGYGVLLGGAGIMLFAEWFFGLKGDFWVGFWVGGIAGGIVVGLVHNYEANQYQKRAREYELWREARKARNGHPVRTQRAPAPDTPRRDR